MKNDTGSVGIIIDEDKVLLMHRINDGKEYYTFIGGHREGNENPEETLIREVSEESGVDVKPEKLLYRLGDEDGFVNYFLCKYIGGTPQLGMDSIESEKMKHGNQFYKPVWIAIDELRSVLIYPIEIKDWFLKDRENDYINTPRETAIERKDRRQTL